MFNKKEYEKSWRKENSRWVNKRSRMWRAENLSKVKKYLKENAERIKKRNKKLREERREKTYITYGGKCVCCGETEFIFLTLDHVDNDGAAHRRKIKHSDLIRWAVKNNFPKSLQLLCFNCNCGRHRNGGECPHTSGSSK